MDELGLRRGVPGLPGSEGRYAYQVNFATLGNPFDAEVIVIFWLDAPACEEDRLRRMAVERLREMVERGA